MCTDKKTGMRELINQGWLCEYTIFAPQETALTMAAIPRYGRE